MPHAAPTAPFEQPFAYDIYKQKYAHPGEEWPDTARRVATHVLAALYHAPNHGPDYVPVIEDATTRVEQLIGERRFMPGGRYLYATGRPLHQTQNCLLLRADDSREGWADLQQKAAMALMTGAGIGVWYGDVRAAGSSITRTGGVASGPVSLMQIINEIGRHTMQGGSRRSAIWAGLPWNHPDVDAFIRIKDYPMWLREQKAKDHTTPAPLDMTNISVSLDDEFFEAYEHPSHPEHERAVRVYRKAVDKMLTTAEPGFSVDRGRHAGEVLRNACTEVTSADDSDVCNLGSLVLSRFTDPSDFEAAVADAVLFLTAGTLYSDLPYAAVDATRQKNRRLGLGVMGVHEFCLQRGVRYGSPESMDAMRPFAEAYERALRHAHRWQDYFGLSRSVAATAIAPTGTIGIVGETTTGIEPIFAAAYERTVIDASPDGDVQRVEYVVDPTARRLVESGVDPELIEDAYSLSYDYERRFAMQHFWQRYTDHGISSTVNLPRVVKDEDEQHEFGDILMKYLPELRGITCYPDGARPGQPLVAVPIEVALASDGYVVEEDEEKCVGGVCGI